MTFLAPLATRSLENPGIPITGATISELFSGGRRTKAGPYVSPDNALRLGAAFRGVQILGTAVGSLPFKVYREDTGALAKNDVSKAIGGHTQIQTSFERWQTATAHMATWGSAVFTKRRTGGNGLVTSLMPVHPSRVNVSVVEDDEFGLVRKFNVDGKTNLTSYDILHIPFMSLDGVNGLGPIGYCREMFGTALSAEEAAAAMLGQGLMMSGFITTDAELTKTQAKQLKAKWRRNYQGSSNAGDIGVLDSGASFERLSMPPKDAQFIEQRKFSVTDVGRLLGIPSWMINDQEKSTSWGTGMETMFSTFVITTLAAYINPIEQRVALELLPDTYVAKLKVEGLLRGDSKSRAAFYASGIENGWLVPNEPRGWEDLQPVAWGDKPYLPHNTPAGTDPANPDDEEDLP